MERRTYWVAIYYLIYNKFIRLLIREPPSSFLESLDENADVKAAIYGLKTALSPEVVHPIDGNSRLLNSLKKSKAPRCAGALQKAENRNGNALLILAYKFPVIRYF